MTKKQFLRKLAEIYRFANLTDSGNAPEWTKPEMAGRAGCAAMDNMLREMVKCGAITEKDHQAFVDGMLA